MSYQTFFLFASGLAKPLYCPPETLAGIREHIRSVEATLCLETEQYLENPPHWKRNNFEEIEDEVLCETVREHNDWVRYLHGKFGEWAKASPEGAEVISVEDAKTFWHALTPLEASPERWTRDYYRNRMEHLYEVMRGRDNEGVSLDKVKPLTQQQSAAVIGLFAPYLDTYDLRVDVPEYPGRGFNGMDYLASSYDGGYDWCSGDHGTGCFKAIHGDHVGECRKKNCPLRAEREEDEEGE
jgi:hypothetical protein